MHSMTNSCLIKLSRHIFLTSMVRIRATNDETLPNITLQLAPEGSLLRWTKSICPASVHWGLYQTYRDDWCFEGACVFVVWVWQSIRCPCPGAVPTRWPHGHATNAFWGSEPQNGEASSGRRISHIWRWAERMACLVGWCTTTVSMLTLEARAFIEFHGGAGEAQ